MVSGVSMGAVRYISGDEMVFFKKEAKIIGYPLKTTKTNKLNLNSYFTLYPKLTQNVL